MRLTVEIACIYFIKPHSPRRGPPSLACGLGPRTALTLPMSFTTVLPFHYPKGKVEELCFTPNSHIEAWLTPRNV